jgi:hypothetical protein
MRPNIGTIFGRVVAVVSGLLLAGIVLRLIVAILQPVLPARLSHDLAAGFDFLYAIVSPAIPAIGAVGILAALVWVIASRRR